MNTCACQFLRAGGMTSIMVGGGRTLLTKQWSQRRTVSTFINFQDLLSSRRAQAQKSVLIQLPSQESAHDLRNHLQSSFGPLEVLYHYSIPKKGKGGSNNVPLVSNMRTKDQQWLLAEFSSPESASECLKACDHTEGTVPYKSSMCLYQSSSGSKGKSPSKTTRKSEEHPEILFESLSGQAQSPNFKAGRTLGDQLQILQNATKLSELGIRVRFLIACQLEQAFSSLFPQGCVLPFGSTVSGIGRQSGDLDLVLLPDSREVFPIPEEKTGSSKTKNEIGKLYYQSKLFTAPNSSNARFQVQRVMETMADIIQLFIPGCLHVQRILQARVPILRFWSDFTDLQCDLSTTNSSGVHMSELIYLMCQLEPRFPTLLFTVRAWAAGRKITNPVPGRQPTNFMFVLLLIYFLQQKQLLPTLDVLFNNASDRDHRVTADGIDCTFIRSKDQILRHFTPRLSDELSLAELLFDFFEFYSEFNFNTKGVSVVTGNSWGKPDTAPLYIQNPLERHLNVARNVSKEEVVRLKSECCSALWKLETSWNDLHHSQSSKKPSTADLNDWLLTPTLDARERSASAADQRLLMKELFTKS